MISDADINKLVNLAIEAANTGDKALARKYLADALKENPRNLRAWYVLSQVVEERERIIYCLDKMLEIQPNNEQAIERLRKLGSDLPSLKVTSLSLPTNRSRSYQTEAVSSQYLPYPPSATSGNPSTIGIIIIIMLVVLGLFWLGIGFLQLYLGINGIAEDTSGAGELLCFGPWNIFMSIIILWMIRDVLKRYRRVVANLKILAIVGTIFGIFQMFSLSPGLQICTIPIYILLGVLAQISKEEYTEEPPRRTRPAKAK